MEESQQILDEAQEVAEKRKSLAGLEVASTGSKTKASDDSSTETNLEPPASYPRRDTVSTLDDDYIRQLHRRTDVHEQLLDQAQHKARMRAHHHRISAQAAAVAAAAARILL